MTRLLFVLGFLMGAAAMAVMLGLVAILLGWEGVAYGSVGALYLADVARRAWQ